MPLITPEEFRDRFDVSPDIDSKRIEPHIGSASRRLRKWVGDAVYTQADNVTDNDAADANLVSDLKNAEAHLAFHFALLGFNSPLTTKGVVATSMSGEGKELRKYLSPAENQALAIQFLELAREMAGPYSVTDDVPESSFEFDDGGDCS